KGGVNWASAVVAIATTARNETTQALVTRLMKFSDLVMLEISLLTGELDNVITKVFFSKTARQNSAAICAMARAGTCKLWPTIFPFSLRRTFLPSAGGIVMVAARTSAVGLYRMKLRRCAGTVRWKRVRLERVKQVKVHQHTLPVAEPAEPLKHQVHPDRLAGATDFLADIPSLTSKF